jgi:2-iminobutanoate/2-iminopropanoate deaminase
MAPRGALRPRVAPVGGIEDIAEVGVLLTNPADFAGMNEEYATWFPSTPPARYVAKLGVELPGVLISIRMTAFTG